MARGDPTRCVSSSASPPAPADKHCMLGTNVNHYAPTMSAPVTTVLATSLSAPSTTTTLHEFLNCNHATAFWPVHSEAPSPKLAIFSTIVRLPCHLGSSSTCITSHPTIAPPLAEGCGHSAMSFPAPWTMMAGQCIYDSKEEG